MTEESRFSSCKLLFLMYFQFKMHQSVNYWYLVVLTDPMLSMLLLFHELHN